MSRRHETWNGDRGAGLVVPIPSRFACLLALLLCSNLAGAGRYSHHENLASGGGTHITSRVTAVDTVGSHSVGTQIGNRQIAYWGFLYVFPVVPSEGHPTVRILRVGSIVETNVAAGRLISLPLLFTGGGTAARASVSLAYDPEVLEFAWVTNGFGGVAVSAVSMVQTGRLGFEISFDSLPQTPSNQVSLADLQFRIRSVSGQVVSLIEFVDSPLPNGVFDAGGEILDTTFVGGSVALRSRSATNVTSATGLIGETITVGVPTGANTNRGYLRVLIDDLGVDSLGNPIRVINAAGTDTNGVPFVIFPGTQVDGNGLELDLEYYVSDRRTSPLPTFVVEWVDATFPTAPAGSETIPLLRGLVHQGSFYLDFRTDRSHDYYIQYTDGSVTGPWQTSFPAVSGSGFTAQWIDNGPPRTAARVGQTGARFYRVLRAP